MFLRPDLRPLKRSDVREVGSPPAESRLLQSYLFLQREKELNDVLVVGNPTSSDWILNSAKKFNVMRPDLQQPETNSTPFVISKTNSSDTTRYHGRKPDLQILSQKPLKIKSPHSILSVGTSPSNCF